MKLRILIVGAALAIACPLLSAQTGLPDPLAGTAAQATFGGEAKATNTLNTTLRVSSEVYDNALNSSTDSVTDTITRFDPTFDWQMGRKRWTMSTTYTPGISYSLELPQFRTFSHSLTNSVNLLLARHWNLRVRNAFQRSSDPFDAFNGPQTISGFGVLDGTNPSYLGMPTLLTSNQSGLDLTYQPAAHTTVGVSGSYANTTYDDLIATGPNRDTHMVNGRAFVDQKLSARQSVSVAYDYSLITAQAYGRTVAHSILLFDNWQLNPKFSISVFGGPEYTDVAYGSIESVVPLQSGWSWSAGGTLNWHGERTGLSANAVRRVSDGGGLGGAVEMTSFSAGLTRKIGRSWNADVNATYVLNGSNGAVGTDGNVNFLTAGGGFSRQIGRAFSVDLHYTYLHENRSLVPLNYFGNHNRLTVGFSYTFSNRLGM